MHCPEHPENDLFEDYSTGDIVCTDCGLVVGDRCLEPYQSTVYKEENYDDNLPPKSIIWRLGEQIHLSEPILVKAEEILTRIKSLSIFKAKPEDLCTAVALFAACRIENVPRSYYEISLATQTPKKNICRYYKIYIEKSKSIVKNRFGSSISRYSAELKIDHTIEKRAEILRNELKNTYENNSPLTVVASAIFIACEENKHPLNMNEIAQIVGVHSVTAGKLVRKFKNAQSSAG